MRPWYLAAMVVIALGCSEVVTAADGAPAPRDTAPDKSIPSDVEAPPDASLDAFADRAEPETAVPEDAAPDVAVPDDAAPDVTAPEDAAPDVVAPDAPPPMSRNVRCGSPRPEGAPRPPPLPAYTGGMCPTFAQGRNTFRSMGNMRSFILVAPRTTMPGERLPVLFLWHWLGGSANGFLTQGNVQAAVDRYRFVAVIPEKKGDVAIVIPFVRSIDMVWPYLTSSTPARVAEEVTFFDDMLACVAAQYSIDEDCISSVGVSAGALWTSQLRLARSTRLASAIVLSGGVGPASGTTLLDVQGWRPTAPPRSVPTLVLWGGATDTCAINFQTASRNLERALVATNSFVMECVHNCGHDVPPVEDPTLGVAALYQFAFDHPYWLEPRESPYIARGLPAGMPTWCAIGPGSARIRTGMCEAGGPACNVPALP